MYKKFLLYEALKQAREKRNSKVVKHNKTDVCRVCMATNVTMVGIFDCVNRNLAEDIEFCTGILISENDSLPKKICQSCLQKLKTAYIFKSKCLSTDKKLKTLSVNVKVEIKREKSDDESHDEVVNTGDEYADDFFGDRNHSHKSDKRDVTYIEITSSSPRTETSRVFENLNISIWHLPKNIDEHGKEQLDAEEHKESISILYSIHIINVSSTPVEPNTSLEALLNPLHCDLCGANFTTILEKRRHRAEQHKNELKRKSNDKFICELCGKQLANRLTMRSHVKSHQPPNMFCAHCDYKTNNRSDLCKHLKLHTGEKRHQCKYCSRLFTVNSNLRIHIRRIHENNGMKQFGCNICDAKYTTKISLNRHMDGHYNKRNFECQICHSRFNNRFSWRKHVKKVHKMDVPSIRGGRVKEHFVEDGDTSGWDRPSVLL